MEKTIEYLIKRIVFLEALLEVNLSTMDKAMSTNRMLAEELKKRVE